MSMLIFEQYITPDLQLIFNNICATILENSTIDFIEYVRTFNNFSRIMFTSNEEWSKYVLEQEFVKVTNFEPNHHSLEKSGVFIWDSLAHTIKIDKDRRLYEKKVANAKENFNIANGIAIIEEYDDYCDYYNFGGTRDNLTVLTYYLNHLEELYAYILYFKDRAKTLIDIAKKKPIILPYTTKNNNKLSDNNIKVMGKPKYNIEDIQYFHIKHGKKELRLTKRTATYLALTLKGYSYKRTALLAEVSPKTVESSIRQQVENLGFYTKEEMIVKLNNDKSIQMFVNALLRLM